MTRDKQIHRFAKSLVRLSIEDGRVSGERVAAVLAGLRRSPPRRVVAILQAYLRLLRREIDKQTARVAGATALSADLLESVERALAGLYDRPVTAVGEIDPSLIAGLRIRIGDDVIDASIAGHLERLAAAVH